MKTMNSALLFLLATEAALNTDAFVLPSSRNQPSLVARRAGAVTRSATPSRLQMSTIVDEAAATDAVVATGKTLNEKSLSELGE